MNIAKGPPTGGTVFAGRGGAGAATIARGATIGRGAGATGVGSGGNGNTGAGAAVAGTSV